MIIANKKRIIKIEKIRNKYNNLYFANKFVMLCYYLSFINLVLNI